MRRIDKIREQHPDLDQDDKRLALRECPGFYSKAYPIPKPDRGCGLHDKGAEPDEFHEICQACWHEEE